MTTTLPSLPKPDTHCFDDDTQTDCWSYSNQLLKEYCEAVRVSLQPVQPNPLTDEQIETCWPTNFAMPKNPKLMKFARAILALQAGGGS